MKRLIGIKGMESGIVDAISSYVFSNPFGQGWGSIRGQLQDAFPSRSYGELKEQFRGFIRASLDKALSGKANARTGDGVETLVLLNVYLTHYEELDGLIQKQIESGAEPVAVPFARDAIGALVRSGFSEEDALRYFALMFQMRRAYYFISRNILGQSPAMNDLRQNLWRNVFTDDILMYVEHLWSRMEDFSTLMLGETGTGKGLAALSIGWSGFIPFDLKKNTFSESFTKSFVSLNLSQYPEQLIESELFGYKKGAFTGAINDHEGVLSRCSPHGAIFLDEIGEVPHYIQIKLLHVLQERRFSPVGSHDSRRFHGRVITATNKGIDRLYGGKLFRDDFFFRICSDIIEVPSLRERLRQDPDELGALVGHILARVTGAASERMTAGVIEQLARTVPADYHWPGNVRELEQSVRRILLNRNYEIVRMEQDGSDDSLMSRIERGAISADELLSEYCNMLYRKSGSYKSVANVTGMDARTVKKYLDLSRPQA